MKPSSAHAWWADACGVLLHYSTILGPATLGEAPQIHGVCVFYLALASFYLDTLCVRCPPTQYPTNNQPPSWLNNSINNRRMRTFYVAIVCACIVGRCLCSMVALFHYFGAGSSRWSSRNDGKKCQQICRLAITYHILGQFLANRAPNWSP
jgi:hypothetical protein